MHNELDGFWRGRYGVGVDTNDLLKSEKNGIRWRRLRDGAALTIATLGAATWAFGAENPTQQEVEDAVTTTPAPVVTPAEPAAQESVADQSGPAGIVDLDPTTPVIDLVTPEESRTLSDNSRVTVEEPAVTGGDAVVVSDPEIDPCTGLDYGVHINSREITRVPVINDRRNNGFSFSYDVELVVESNLGVNGILMYEDFSFRVIEGIIENEPYNSDRNTTLEREIESSLVGCENEGIRELYFGFQIAQDETTVDIERVREEALEDTGLPERTIESRPAVKAESGAPVRSLEGDILVEFDWDGNGENNSLRLDNSAKMLYVDGSEGGISYSEALDRFEDYFIKENQPDDQFGQMATARLFTNTSLDAVLDLYSNIAVGEGLDINTIGAHLNYIAGSKLMSDNLGTMSGEKLAEKRTIAENTFHGFFSIFNTIYELATGDHRVDSDNFFHRTATGDEWTHNENVALTSELLNVNTQMVGLAATEYDNKITPELIERGYSRYANTLAGAYVDRTQLTHSFGGSE